MSYPTDPLRLWKRRRATALTAGAAAVFLTLLWAVQPGAQMPAAMPTPPSSSDVERLPVVAPALDRSTVDPAAFEVVLWDAPKPPKPQELVVEPVAPPNVELVAVIMETGRWQAALYDGQSDRLRLVRAGERIGVHEVVAVDARSVHLRAGTKQFVLRLTSAPPGEGESAAARAPNTEGEP